MQTLALDLLCLYKQMTTHVYGLKHDKKRNKFHDGKTDLP